MLRARNRESDLPIPRHVPTTKRLYADPPRRMGSRVDSEPEGRRREEPRSPRRAALRSLAVYVNNVAIRRPVWAPGAPREKAMRAARTLSLCLVASTSPSPGRVGGGGGTDAGWRGTRDAARRHVDADAGELLDAGSDAGPPTPAPCTDDDRTATGWGVRSGSTATTPTPP